MSLPGFLFICLLTLGFYSHHTIAQTSLTTKCPNSYWKHHKQRCYLIVDYAHSLSKSFSYCQKYGAKLAEPRGFTINNYVADLVHQEIPSADAFRIGHQVPSSSTAASWTGVNIGVWGPREPDLSAGSCTYVDVSSKKWFMGQCDTLMPFVCELDPCPAGPSSDKDTFMCNGKCIGRSLVCDWKDDCGDNMDELNCANQNTYTFTQPTGTIAMPDADLPYEISKIFTWTLHTQPGTRIIIQFEKFEIGGDTLAIHDGGPTFDTSNLNRVMSGDTSEDFISSYNFLILRFVSDGVSNLGSPGFEFSWATTLGCEFNMKSGYTFSNTEIQSGSESIGSRQTIDHCKNICTQDCYGFSYHQASRSCRFFNKLPVLMADSSFNLYSSTCPPSAQMKALVPEFPKDVSALASVNQIVTAWYPRPYPGNYEVEYKIHTAGNYHITIEAVIVDLCCGDYVVFYDEQHDEFDRLTSDSSPSLILSTGNTVYVRMILESHAKCIGVLLNYTQGCNPIYTGTGVVSSPGRGTTKSYQGLTLCTMTVNAPTPEGRLTLKFDDFDLSDTDSLTLRFPNGTTMIGTGTSLHEKTLITTSGVMMTFLTSSFGSGRGFSMSYSPGCYLNTDSYDLSDSNFNVGDSFALRCADGYFFTGIYQNVASVDMSCLSGGMWNPEVPVCQQAICGPAPGIENGYVNSSTGIKGSKTARYSCYPGFMLQNNAQIKCQADNTWEPRPNCSSPQCPAISALASNTSSQEIVRGRGTSHGSVARLTCNDQGEIIGAETVLCKQGAWDFVNNVASSCRDKPCATPLITNALLSPPAPYTIGQPIAASCNDGFQMMGPSTFQCGIGTDLPECIMTTCVLNGIENLAADNMAAPPVNYGQNMVVWCAEGYELLESTTTTMTLSCLSTGWDRIPACVPKKCKEPYQVKGSVYTYIGEENCWDVGCSFTFTCMSGFELDGTSSQDDTIVRCGEDYVWDFNTIRCEGGQCTDPGNPASGRAIGDSYGLDELVTFECDDDGFTALNKNGSPNTGIKCIYNSELNMHEWDGEVPTCNDTEPPEIVNCPTAPIEIEPLAKTDYPEPYGRDNNGIMNSTSNLKCLRSGQNIRNGQNVLLKATDWAGNSVSCSFQILIPRWIECSNERTTILEVGPLSSGQITEMYNGLDYIVNFADAPITPNDLSVTFNARRETKNLVQELEVMAWDGDNVVDSCTLQFRFSAKDCAPWVLNMPNTNINYNSNDDNYELTCDPGYYFMESPGTEMISMNCANNEWNRDPPPICVTKSETENVVIFRVNFIIQYTVNEDITDIPGCESWYESQVEANLQGFASDMSVECGSSFTVTLWTFEVTPSTNTIEVLFTFIIDEPTDNGETRVTCVNTIQSILSTSNDIPSLQNIDGNSACGPGLHDKDFGSSLPSYSYDCKGNRKYWFLPEQNERVCLECRIGHYYSTTEDDCLECGRGTYRDDTNADNCQPCPDGGDPGFTALTSAAECSIKSVCGPGYFSKSGLSPCTICPRHFYNPNNASHSCAECASNEITEEAGAVSSSFCMTQEDAAEHPCTNNPCMNGGNCSICSHTYFCDCPLGFTGDTCETAITPCSSNPCENDQSCTVNGDTFICQCNSNPSDDTELHGTYCEKDRYGCGGNLCQHNSTCHNQRGSYTCKCPSHGGYTNSGVCDTPIDQCEVNACQNDGTCIPSGSFYRQCLCPPGYEGFDCGTNTDDCSPDPCQNGATCVDDVDSYSCTCVNGYHGHHCQFIKACDHRCGGLVTDNCHTCDITGMTSCINIQNSYSCSCKAGYTGTSCEVAISVCNSYPCQHGGTCEVVSDTAFNCVCEEPWTGQMCETQINNCKDASLINEGVQCFSSPTECICTCPLNYISDEDEECDIAYDACDALSPCVEGSTCSLSATGVWSCSCPDGYSGDSCQTRDPYCSSTTCANGGTCDNTGGQISCDCVAGYSGTYCEEDINECSTNPCPQNQHCVDGVNSYTCECNDNKWGQNCDIDYYNRDILIERKSLCREEASMIATFGDGVTDITELTFGFFERFYETNGDEVILSMIGSNTLDEYIPSDPDLTLTFTATEVVSYTNDAGRRRRKKRAVRRMTYGVGNAKVTIADGYWHHIAFTFNTLSGEIDLYVDGTYKNQIILGNNFGSRWFLVPGAYDTSTGQTVPGDSHIGRLANLWVIGSKLTDSQIGQLYQRTPTPSFPNILQQRNLIEYYVLNYTSELVSSTCVPSDSNCQPLSTGASVPTVNTCPGDTLVFTDRGGTPNWTDPTFSGATGDIASNHANGDTAMDWGVHGISYAAFDGVNSASVCAFHLYNYKEITCTVTEGVDLPSSENIAGGKRYKDQCPDGKSIAGGVPLYQVCNMYSFWNGDIQYNFNYTYPVCTESQPLTAQTSLMLDLDVINIDCQSVLDAYKVNLRTQMSELNSDLGGKLCPSSCFTSLNAATYTCVSDDLLRLNINLGLLERSMSYSNGGSVTSVTVEEALNIAVGDSDRHVFTYEQTSNQQTIMVKPKIRSLAVTSPSTCETGYEISGNLCVKCGAGTAYTSNQVCERCTKGSYSSAQSSANECVTCHVSRTTQGSGSTSSDFCKTKCLPGLYYEPISGECTACAVGYYQDSLDGAFSCLACGHGLTTATTGAQNSAACVSPASITTTTQTPGGPVTGASTEDTGLGAGVIVVIVLAILLGLVFIIFIICFCCCRDMLPCFKKQKQIVAPSAKEGYYANKYGEHNMQFVSYNLRDVREKKGRSLDKVPIVEQPLSDETGSVKTDISVHVPVFNEKLDGKIKKKSLYISNGGTYMNSTRTRSLMSSREQTPRTYERPPLTSSPRDTHYDEVQEEPEYHRRQSKKRRRKRKDRSGERSHRSADRSHRRSDYEERSHRSTDRSHRRSDYEERSYRSRSAEHAVNDYDEINTAAMPKALAPMPHRIKSLPKAEAHLRPLSPLERPRPQVEPNEYRDFIQGSPKRSQPQKSNFMSRSYDDDYEPTETAIQRIEVESDLEDLR